MINMTANGDSAVQQTAPGALNGLVQLFVQVANDLGGGTLALMVDCGSGYVSEYEWTEAKSQIFELPAAVNYKFTLSGATSPDVDIEIR